MKISVHYLFATFWIAILLSACSNLDHVAKYSKTSVAVMQNQALVNGIPATVKRRQEMRGGATIALGISKENGKRLQKVQRVYEDYFTSLGALAVGDLVSFKKQFDGFEKSLKASGVVSEAEAGLIRKVGESVTSVSVDIYRRRELAKVIQKCDPAVQAGVKEMIRITGNFNSSLERERNEVANAVNEMKAGSEDRVLYLLMDFQSRREATIDAELKKSAALKEALTTVAVGHKDLVVDSNKLTAKELKALIDVHSEHIKAAYKALTDA